MNSIIWPEKYTPGTTDNFVSNEVIVANLSAREVWTYLVDTRWWPGYYENVSDIHFYDATGPKLAANSRFRFTTFRFPVEAQVVEFIPPAEGQPARLAWRGWVEGDEDKALDALHAWLIEELPGARVRILTQESQTGKPAQQLAATTPNPMLNAHQAWLDGLAKTALAQKGLPGIKKRGGGLQSR
ncbi:polyketide cyclase [Franconibacter pulveris]|uniref:Polyketide cyclase n=1 Tax=Franconibacter pulveris TaxID=435910 RepID=A0A0J8VRJ0_9ENTR|nr:polyketide cyclase [Franconibacter pulveris]KMV35801.1 polyketide cyclase [Franconibacter pulveris]